MQLYRIISLTVMKKKLLLLRKRFRTGWKRQGIQRKTDNMAENRENTMKSTDETGSRQISVRFGENTVICELNDNPAAASLYEQLPITTEVEDF